ncbi:MAG: CHAT domain-containing protein, partial [Acidimicrobiales bacterium]
QGKALAELGLRLVLETEDASLVLLWAERLKAGALDLPPVRPPQDEALALAMADVRNLEAQLREETAAGTADAELRERLQNRRQTVSQTLRGVSGQASSDSILGPDELNNLLAVASDRFVVEFLVSGGLLWSVSVMSLESQLHCLGPVTPVERELDNLLFAIRRAARGPVSEASADAVRKSIERSVAFLDEFLFAGVEVPPGTEAVVVPTGRLHELPWGALPSLRGRAPVVTPSLRLWCRAPRGSSPSANELLLMAAPGLDSAEAEIAEVAAIYAVSADPPVVLVHLGPAATPTRALELLERVDVAHIAAHGSFRDESPMFSSIHLDGGSLTVHDLETMASAPRLVLLPACSAGRSGTHFGDELLGTTGALLSIGVESLIAPDIEVPDDATRHCMAALHQKLAAGLAPNVALDEMVSEVIQDSDLRRVSAGLAFVCFGTL